MVNITNSVFMLRMALRDIIASVTAFLNCLQGKEDTNTLKRRLKYDKKNHVTVLRQTN